MRISMMATVFGLSLAAALACNRESQAGTPSPTAPAPSAATTATPGAPAQAPTPAALAPAPAEQAQPEAAGGDKQYRVEVAEARLKVGATADFKLTIKPGAGLHFNAEYPAKFVVAAAAFAKSTKDKLSTKGGEVKIEGNDGVVTVPLQGLAAGSGNLEITGSFSVCSSEQCYMLRDEKLAIKVTVN